MKFDICLMNPPYSTTSDNIHLKFVDKINEISIQQVVIFPISFITKQNIKSQIFYKEKWNNILISIEEVPSTLFIGTSMPNCGIYYFNNIKNTDTISIQYLNNNKFEINSLLNISKFNNYESNIEQYFKNKERVNIYNLGYWITLNSLKKQGITDSEKIREIRIKNINDCVKKLPNNKVFLICNSINGAMNGKYFTQKIGQIINGKDNLIKYIYNINNVSNGYNAIVLNSEKEAENCKTALNHPLLRFLLYKLQQDQRMTINKCYKYVPDIDWSDPRVVTDKGLLEVCGCPKDKAKEYAEYCRKYMEEFDNE